MRGEVGGVKRRGWDGHVWSVENAATRQHGN